MRGKTETDKHNTQVSEKPRKQYKYVSSMNICISKAYQCETQKLS